MNLPFLSLFGFNIREAAVLRALAGGQTESVSNLAKQSGQPRTSVHAVLQRLHDHGWVRKVSVGKRTHWRLVSPARIRRKIATFLESLEQTHTTHLPDSGVERIDLKEVGIKVFQGREQIQAAYVQFFQKPDQRLYVVQGHQFVIAYQSSVFTKESELLLKQVMSSNNVIIEGVMAESNLHAILAMDADPAYVEAVFSVPYIINVVPDELLDFPLECIISSTSVAFSLPSQQLFITISQPNLVQFCNSYLRLLLVSARKVNAFDLKQTLLDQK